MHEVSARFYDAVNTLLHGDPAPMLALWSHAEDATCCDPSNVVVRGWDALERYWRDAAERNAAARDKLSATGEEVAVAVSGELAYVVVTETVRHADGSLLLVARATNVYRREDGCWRLVHGHADAAPCNGDAPHADEERCRAICQRTVDYHLQQNLPFEYPPATEAQIREAVYRGGKRLGTIFRPRLITSVFWRRRRLGSHYRSEGSPGRIPDSQLVVG